MVFPLDRDSWCFLLWEENNLIGSGLCAQSLLYLTQFFKALKITNIRAAIWTGWNILTCDAPIQGYRSHWVLTLTLHSVKDTAQSSSCWKHHQRYLCCNVPLFHLTSSIYCEESDRRGKRQDRLGIWPLRKESWVWTIISIAQVLPNDLDDFSPAG